MPNDNNEVYDMNMKKWFVLLCSALLCLVPVTAWASPLTGDRGIGMWIVLLVVSAIVLIGVVVLMVMKNRRR